MRLKLLLDAEPGELIPLENFNFPLLPIELNRLDDPLSRCCQAPIVNYQSSGVCCSACGENPYATKVREEQF